MALLTIGSVWIATLRQRSDLAEKRADPNRWACMYASRGYGVTDDPDEYQAIMDTAISFATSPEVRDGLRRYAKVAKSDEKADPGATKAYTNACDPYLPFDRFDP